MSADFNAGSGAQNAPANTKLFVGNLPYSATNQSLADKFSEAGTVVEATIIMNRQTGRSKGFGFVQMSTPEEAQKAIEMFNEQDFEGRNMIVNIARPMEPREDRPRSDRYGSDRPSYGSDRSYGRSNDRRGGGGYGRNDR